MTVNEPYITSNKSLLYLCDHERLDLTRMRDMRADAQVDHRATAVHRRRFAVGDLRLDKVLLVLVVLHKTSAPCSIASHEQH